MESTEDRLERVADGKPVAIGLTRARFDFDARGDPPFAEKAIRADGHAERRAALGMVHRHPALASALSD